VTNVSEPVGTVEIIGEPQPETARVLTPEAMAFVARLQRAFNPTRTRLLAARTDRQATLDAGARPGLLAETAAIRAADWRVAPPPPALAERHVEITGPTDRKMMINALNSGASGFMADLEDSLSPTWANVVAGHANLMDAVHGTLAYTSPEGRTYQLGPAIATLLVRPRGWHLEESHVHVDGHPVSASLFDFGIFFYHNARALAARGAGPFFYLPKLESHHEARLWNDVFIAAQDALGMPRGTIRATVLIETILAAFEMEEILYELRDHGAALNAGRWDYIFSIIKKFRTDPAFVLPDRVAVTMGVPFMQAYAERLARTCHWRGAQAIGGMAAFIPSRRDEAINRTAFARVREDKMREATRGFDGTWIAHPDLVPVARAAFAAHVSHAGTRSADPPGTDLSALLDVRIPGSGVTAVGVNANVRVALEYLVGWIGGSGAVGIDNLMEDTATAEISRAQLWQWRRHRVPVDGGGPLTRDGYASSRDTAMAILRERGTDAGRLADAAALLDELVLNDTFAEFLTVAGARYLDRETRTNG
jgi:malate synthase